MKKYLPFFILISLVTLIAISTYKINKTQEIAQKSSIFTKKDEKIADFELVDLFDNNQKFTQKNLIGQYSVINFFASWCTSCKSEHKMLFRLKNHPKIKLYGVAWRDIDDNTKKFLSQNHNPFLQVLKDPKSELGNLISLQAVPETIVVNPEGLVIARFRGVLDDEIIAEIVNIVE